MLGRMDRHTHPEEVKGLEAAIILQKKQALSPLRPSNVRVTEDGHREGEDL
jgi:hypothetical protein